MKIGGYAGQVLWVDLTSGQVHQEPLDLDLAKDFIGGFGINAKLAYDLIKPGADPLGPDNAIIVGAGTLAGTMAPGSSRLTIATKFPETATVAFANGSLGFAPQLKYAGYDHVIITGRAPRPVYLYISNGNTELCEAQDLWGRDLYEASDELWRRHGTTAGIVAIGPAGENRVGISLALVDKSATLGKGGFGAVMGAKNLKAIVAQGTGGVGVADGRGFMQLIDRYIERVRAYPLHKTWVEEGINYTWRDRMARELPCHDWTDVYPKEKADALFGVQVYLQKAKKARLSCPSCPIADKEVLEVKEGEYQGLVTYTAGFSGRAENFGIRCNVGGYDKVIKCVDLSNRLGIDSHSVSSIIDYAVHLYEKGIITPADTGGRPLRRDFDTTVRLLEQIAYRQGLGDTLADGMAAMVARFGPEAAQESVYIKGLESIFDPRASGLGTMEFEQLVNPRGGHHQSGGSPAYSPGSPMDKFARHCDRMGAPGDAIDRILDPATGLNPARLTRYAEDWYAVLSSLGLCNRAQINRFHSITSCAELYTAATGLQITAAELAKAGERGWNVMKASNVREGFSRKDDRMPEKWFRPIPLPDGRELRMRDYYGSKTLTPEDVEKLLDDYYNERGWDKKTGWPSKEKLVELGLGEIAQELAAILAARGG